MVNSRKVKKVSQSLVIGLGALKKKKKNSIWVWIWTIADLRKKGVLNHAQNKTEPSDPLN